MRNVTHGSYFIRHFIFAMEAHAHREQWSSIPSYMQYIISKLRFWVEHESVDKQRKLKKVQIIYDKERILSPLYFY